MTNGLTDRLRREWISDLDRSGAPLRDREAAFDELVRRYGEPHRHHHTLEHVASVRRWVDALADLDRARVDRRAVSLAAWYHDVIHEPGSRENEVRSALQTRVGLAALGVDRSTVEESARLVECTATHDPGPNDHNAAVLVDADLAVLSASPTRFDRYRAAIRAEYPDIDDDVFRRERAAVLGSFLDRSYIYSTECFRSEREPRARANLGREFAELTGPFGVPGSPHLRRPTPP